MVFTLIIKGFFVIVDWIIGLLPTLPAIINFSDNIFTTFNDLIFNNLGLLDLFVPLSVVRVLIAGMVGYMVAKIIFDIVMFIIRKIPLASME